MAALAIAAYAGSVPSSLAWDDPRAILQNGVINGTLPVHAAFRTDQFGNRGAGDAGLWRPLALLSLRLDWSLSGGNPHLLHAVNAALHGAVAAVLYVAFSAAFADPPALLAAALFAVFAAPSEAVEAIVGRADLLAALFALAGFLAHVRGRTLAAALLLAAGALCKESAVLAPAAWLLCGPRDRLQAKPAAAYAGALVAVGALRLALFGFHRIPADPMLQPQLLAPAGARLLGAGRTFARFVLPGIVDPFRRLYVCSAPACGPAGPSALAFAGLACAAALVIAPLVLWRRSPAAARGLAWFAILYLPVSNLVVASSTVYAERLLYAPAAGLALAAAAGIAAIPSRAVAWALGAAVMAGNALAVQMRHADWRDWDSLALSAPAIAPDSAQVRHNAAVAELHRGDPAAALDHARAAMQLYPGRGESEAVAALSLAALGQDAEADRLFEKAAEHLRFSAQVTLDWARFLAPRDRARAKEVLRRGLAAHPQDAQLRSALEAL